VEGGTGQPVGGQGQQRGVVGSGAAVLRHLLAQQRPEAELFPSGTGRVQAAIRIDLLDVVDADIRRELPGRQIDAIVVGHAQDALGQAAQGLRIDLVGTAKRIDDTRLRTPSLLVVVIFGELVVDGVGTVLTSLAGLS
jgi:hypothetical protein